VQAAQAVQAEFYSKLNDSEISDDDYERAQSIWKHFGMKSMRVYHDLYLKTDVLLLADVFEQFQKFAWKIIIWTFFIMLQLPDSLGMFA